ncbi:MAG: GGDEF domain-containing protein [Gammaproteobacteria bacterium]
MRRPAMASVELAGSTPVQLSVVQQLRMALAGERRQRRHLEREVLDAQSALVKARAELAGTQAAEQQARHQALHDGLTSLPNRRFFLEQLGQALDCSLPDSPMLSVLYLDLDDFKPVNDQYGHEVGDELLTIISARLSRVVRAEDMMSRLGGDEFACLAAESLNRDVLGHFARKLRDTVSAPMNLGTLTLSVRPSIGIATYPADGATADALLRSADAAMYRAKQLKIGHQFCDHNAPASRPGLRARWAGSHLEPLRRLGHLSESS